MNVAITVRLERNPWKNRGKQSAINLYDCIHAAGENAFYITPTAELKDCDKNHIGYTEEAALTDHIPPPDLLIIHGHFPGDTFLQRFKKRYPKCKIVHYFLENPIAEASLSLTSGKELSCSDLTEELWIPPHQMTNAEYLISLHLQEVTAKVAPYLWSPFFLQESLRSKKYKNCYFDNSRETGVSIIETNTSFVKNFFIPLFACEQVNLRDSSSLGSVSVFNTKNIKNTPLHSSLIKRLSLAKQDKLFLSNNWESPDIYSRCGQYIVSHQAGSQLNYQHLECLYLGLPLIHNSPEISSCGYYYKGSNSSMARNQLTNAILHHANNLPDYQFAAKELFQQFSPRAEANLKKIKKLIYSK